MNELLRAGFITMGNVKISLNDLPPDAWQYLVGGPENAPDLRKYYKSVAWLNRGVNLRAQGVESVPFKLLNKGGDIVDSSDDWKNVLGFMPSFRRTLGMIERGLTMNGREYQFIQRRAIGNRAVAGGLRHMVAGSIDEKYDKDTGELIYFERTRNGKPERLEVKDALYFWLADDAVEIGPPTVWPALGALQAAGVLYAVDGFATAFFERGAIKVTLLTTPPGTTEPERKRLKRWWERILGMAWSTEVVNSEAVVPVQVGEGLESLNNTQLTQEKREDISTALGIPDSILFSNAANFATAGQDKLNWYEDTIIPECEFIADILNEQLFVPLGYRFMFDSQSLAVFQEDEEQRSSAFYNYVASKVRPSIAGEMLGLELPDGVEYAALDEAWNEDREAAQQMRENMSKQPQPEKKPPDATDDMADGNNPRQPEKTVDLRAEDLEKWERMALKRVEAGKPANREGNPFTSENIPDVIIEAITKALDTATTARDVYKIFGKDDEDCELAELVRKVVNG